MSVTSQLKRRLRVAKHFGGWRSTSPLVAFAVDDYGSVRTASASARSVLRRDLPGFGGQMDEFDAMETRQDLEALFEVLARHPDESGQPCVLTAYCLSANPDFARMRSDRVYRYETLAQTYERLESADASAYSNMPRLWREGIEAGVIQPQCHGREHYCVPVIDWKLQQASSDIEANLEVESMAGLSAVPELGNVGVTQAFGLTDSSRIPEQASIIEDGLRLFEEFFGFRSRTFVPPAGKFNRAHDLLLHRLGVEGVDVPFLEYADRGLRRWAPRVNFLSGNRNQRPLRIVRTLSFEPCSGVRSDPVGHALSEVRTAFEWRKPVIISSHRVNYGGYIDAANRSTGLKRLSELISGIKGLRPDVQFVSVDTLVEMTRNRAAA